MIVLLFHVHARQIIPRGGVNKMREKTSLQKVSMVAIKEIAPGKYQLQWSDPQTREYMRRRLTCSIEQAREAAFVISQNILQGKGVALGRSSTPGIKDATERAIRLSSALDETKRNLAGRAAGFVLWIAENYPRVRDWSDLRPSHVREYVSYLHKQGKARDTIRLALVPIKMAWRLVSEDYPEVRPLPKISVPPSPPREIENLDEWELSVALAWLRRVHPTLGAVATLQALAGLRMREAVFLRRQDIDFRGGRVRITETPYHKPKTASSNREIPVCDEVLEAIEESMSKQKVIPTSGEIFLTAYGNPWEQVNLSHRFKMLLIQAAKETKVSRLGELPPRKLRSTFATLAGKLGANLEALKRYMGHTPGSILERHYLRFNPEELEGVRIAIEGWRSLLKKNDCKKTAIRERRKA